MRLLLPVFLLLPAGCFLSESRVDRPLEAGTIRSLEPGTSTAEDVTRMLGAPNRVVELGDRSAWLYQHLHERQTAVFLLVLGLRKVDTQADRCWVFFDQNGRLTHLGSTLQSGDAEYGLPSWGD